MSESDIPASGPSRASGRDKAVGWGLVGVQAALIVAIIFTPTDDAWAYSRTAELIATGLSWIGIALVVWAVLVFGRGVTPSPVPSSKAQLQTRGPYRFVRHPMYSGVIILMAGSAFARRSWLAIALWIALIAFFVLKLRWEEQRLVATYPGYSDYRESVPALVPFTGGTSNPPASE